jgi:hypothetical protein
MMLNLARVQIARGRAAATEPVLRRVIALRERTIEAGDWRIAQARSLLGASLATQGKYDEAEPLMVAAASVLKPMPGLQGRERAANRTRLAALYERLGRPRDADPYR